MDRWKDVYLDNESMWPTETQVELEDPHEDDRGAIQMLVNTPVKNVTLISSVKGSVRANHYHKTDWHYMYMLDGKAEYYFRPHDANVDPEIILWEKGQLVFTPPLEVHTTVFVENSTFLAISRNPRDQESYESDVIRVELVDPSTVNL